MQWVSVMSRADAVADALDEVIDGVWRGLDGAPDFVMVFASRHHGRHGDEIPSRLSRAFAGATVAGCLADSVIGGGYEEERMPAVALTAARLPDVKSKHHLLSAPDDLRLLHDSDPTALLVLVDSYTMDTAALLGELDARFPRAVKFGGLGSAGAIPGANLLFAGDRALESGAVVVEFSGALEVDAIVAQGCRPIGEPMRVTAHQDNVILSFDRGRPQEVLEALYQDLPPEDRRNIPRTLHLGFEVEGAGEAEYLVRPIRGVDPNSGALQLSEVVTEGMRAQFHLRDSAKSSADLFESFEKFKRANPTVSPSGALLFSCVERGEGLFGVRDHDSTMFAGEVGNVPLAGFFGLGEIGPVGDRTFVHAYTSTFALFRPKGES